MISGAQLLGFMAASLVMIIIPGPGVLFVIGRALAHGRRTALATAVGHAAGNFVVAAFVAVGLGAILQRSATAFVVVKVIGAGYLTWSPPARPSEGAGRSRSRGPMVGRDGDSFDLVAGPSGGGFRLGLVGPPPMAAGLGVEAAYGRPHSGRPDGP